MHSTAARSCFSRSVLHSLLWCEPKHWGQGLLGCPGSGGESLLCGLCEGRSNPGSLTKPHSWCFFRDVDSQASRFLSLTFSPSIRRTTLGTLAMSPAPPKPEVPAALLLVWFSTYIIEVIPDPTGQHSAFHLCLGKVTMLLLNCAAATQ